MTENEEIAKAASEVAKFGKQSVQTTEKVLRFVSKVFKEPIEQTSGILGDKLKFLRWERQIRLIDKANEILKERGVLSTRAVSYKLALPILENASIEENDELQDMWINLLANAMDSNFKAELRFAFIEIIKSLNFVDVKILNLFYDVLNEDSKVDFDKITEYSLKKEQICQNLGINEEIYLTSAYNLFRVQCLAPAILKGGITMGSEPLTIFKGVDAVVMTPLGKNFVEACIK